MVVLESCSGFVRPQSSLALLGVMLTLFARHFITYLWMLWEWAGPVLQSPKGPNFGDQYLNPSVRSRQALKFPTCNENHRGFWGGQKCSKNTKKSPAERKLMGICGYLQWRSPYFWTSCLNFRASNGDHGCSSDFEPGSKS